MEALAAAVNAEVESRVSQDDIETPEPAAELNPSEDEGYKSERSRAKRWDKVSTNYIDHRTKDPNRKEARIEARTRRAAEAAESAESGNEMAYRSSKRNADGTWTVATSYIDHRTRDPNNLEVRRGSAESDSEQLQELTRKAYGGATRSSDGSWQVNTQGYINQRTRMVDNLEGRRSRKSEDVPVPSKSAFRQRSGNWAVDTSYIGHHTGDPGTLRKNFKDLARSAEEADRPPGPFDRLSRMQGMHLEAEVENTYRIYAMNAMEDLFCATADSNCVGRHFRSCCGTCAPWTVNIYHTQDLENYEVAYQAYLPATLSCCCIGRPEAQLVDTEGNVLGILKSMGGSGFRIKNSDGGDAFDLEGKLSNLCASLCPLPGMNMLHYTIVDLNTRTEVGSITKKVPSILRLFAKADDDDIRVDFPRVRHPSHKALIMALAVLMGSRNFGGSSSGPRERQGDHRWVAHYENNRTD